MFDTLGKDDLKKLQKELADPIDAIARAHAAASLLNTLLMEEIGKRPDEPAASEAEGEKKGDDE